MPTFGFTLILASSLLLVLLKLLSSLSLSYFCSVLGFKSGSFISSLSNHERRQYILNRINKGRLYCENGFKRLSALQRKRLVALVDGLGTGTTTKLSKRSVRGEIKKDSSHNEDELRIANTTYGFDIPYITTSSSTAANHNLPSNTIQSGTIWALDCAATNHICNSLELLQDIRPVNTFFDGVNATASQAGSMAVEILLANGGITTITLQEVYCIPTLPASLISTRALATEGISVMVDFSRERLNLNGMIVNLDEWRGLYILPSTAQKSVSCHYTSSTPLILMAPKRDVGGSSTTGQATGGVPAISPTAGLLCDHPGCGKKLSSNSALKQHKKLHDPNRAKFACDFPECGKELSTASSLAQHKKTHEPDDAKWACYFPDCGKEFERADELKWHKKTHDPIWLNRPKFACDFPDCGKQYTTVGRLAEHKKIHRERDTAPKQTKDTSQFLCARRQCNRSFYTLAERDQHERDGHLPLEIPTTSASAASSATTRNARPTLRDSEAGCSPSDSIEVKPLPLIQRPYLSGPDRLASDLSRESRPSEIPNESRWIQVPNVTNAIQLPPPEGPSKEEFRAAIFVTDMRFGLYSDPSETVFAERGDHAWAVIDRPYRDSMPVSIRIMHKNVYQNAIVPFNALKIGNIQVKGRLPLIDADRPDDLKTSHGTSHIINVRATKLSQTILGLFFELKDKNRLIEDWGARVGVLTNLASRHSQWAQKMIAGIPTPLASVLAEGEHKFDQLWQISLPFTDDSVPASPGEYAILARTPTGEHVYVGKTFQLVRRKDEHLAEILDVDGDQAYKYKVIRSVPLENIRFLLLGTFDNSLNDEVWGDDFLRCAEQVWVLLLHAYAPSVLLATENIATSTRYSTDASMLSVLAHGVFQMTGWPISPGWDGLNVTSPFFERRRYPNIVFTAYEALDMLFFRRESLLANFTSSGASLQLQPFGSTYTKILTGNSAVAPTESSTSIQPQEKTKKKLKKQATSLTLSRSTDFETDIIRKTRFTLQVEVSKLGRHPHTWLRGFPELDPWSMGQHWRTMALQLQYTTLAGKSRSYYHSPVKFYSQPLKPESGEIVSHPHFRMPRLISRMYDTVMRRRYKADRNSDKWLQNPKLNTIMKHVYYDFLGQAVIVRELPFVFYPPPTVEARDAVDENIKKAYPCIQFQGTLPQGTVLETPTGKTSTRTSCDVCYLTTRTSQDCKPLDGDANWCAKCALFGHSCTYTNGADAMMYLQGLVPHHEADEHFDIPGGQDFQDGDSDLDGEDEVLTGGVLDDSDDEDLDDED